MIIITGKKEDAADKIRDPVPDGKHCVKDITIPAKVFITLWIGAGGKLNPVHHETSGGVAIKFPEANLDQTR